MANTAVLLGQYVKQQVKANAQKQKPTPCRLSPRQLDEQKCALLNKREKWNK